MGKDRVTPHALANASGRERPRKSCVRFTFPTMFLVIIRDVEMYTFESRSGGFRVAGFATNHVWLSCTGKSYLSRGFPAHLPVFISRLISWVAKYSEKANIFGVRNRNANFPSPFAHAKHASETCLFPNTFPCQRTVPKRQSFRHEYILPLSVHFLEVRN